MSKTLAILLLMASTAMADEFTGTVRRHKPIGPGDTFALYDLETGTINYMLRTKTCPKCKTRNCVSVPQMERLLGKRVRVEGQSVGKDVVAIIYMDSIKEEKPSKTQGK